MTARGLPYTKRKPPLGIAPQWHWREMRAHGLQEAIRKRLISGDQFPYEWAGELLEHLEWIHLHREREGRRV